MGETFGLVSLVRVAGDGASPACDLDCNGSRLGDEAASLAYCRICLRFSKVLLETLTSNHVFLVVLVSSSPQLVPHQTHEGHAFQPHLSFTA